MINNFNQRNWEIYQSKDEALDMLKNLISLGKMGLLLGAGASFGFGLPDWEKLVERCCNGHIPFTGDLERDIDNLKQKLSDKEYLNKVKESLYKKEPSIGKFEKIKLDFATANKDLLIAISSLIISRTRGKIDKVISLNYDSILEWYLRINGLKTFVNYKEGLILEDNDVEIIHPHGYLPHEAIKGENSSKIIFSWKELEHFKAQKDNYLKELLYYFLKTKCFISIGVSPKTLQEYIASHISFIMGEYEDKKIEREVPFGFSFVQPSECTDIITNNLRDNFGIIVIPIEHTDVPPYLFKIAQKLAGFEVPYS